MGQTNPSTAELLASSAGQIISKIGIVLAHTKNALLKDLLGDMQNYLPAIASADSYTFEDFKANLKPEETPIGKFIDALFTRLGYDISAFENNKEFADNIRSIIATTISLSENIKQLFDGQTDWMDEARKFAQTAQDGSGKIILPVDELFKDPDLDKIGGISIGNDKVSVSFGGNDKISAILHLIMDLISLVRKFADMEWDKMGGEYGQFGKFMEDTYFSKKFAERIFDHILVVMLRNAREVFADDIDAIVDHIEQAKNDIIAQAKDEVKDKIASIIEQIKALRQEIKSLENQIKAEAKRLQDEARALGRKVVGEVSTELQTRLKVARAKLDKLTSQALGGYNSLGKTFSQIYAVLDFLQVIKKETITVAKYLPDAPSIPSIDMSAVDGLLKKANGVVEGVNKTVEQINQEIAAAADSLKSMCPAVQINVIHWSNLEKLCSDPGGYFQALYPIKDYDDAEALLTKILEVVRAFNADVPDFGSLKALLYELLIRVRDWIRDQANESDELRQLKQTFAKFENFIIDLLKVLEKFAIGVKNELTAAYNEFTADGQAQAKSMIGQLKTGISEAITPFKDSAGKIKNFTIPDTNIKFRKINGVDYNNIKEYLRTVFADPFIKVISEKAKTHDLFSEIKPEEWKAAIEQAIENNVSKNIAGEYQAILGEMEQYVTALFSGEQWAAKFDGAIKALKDEFASQTANVPGNFNEVKTFCQGSIEKLVSGENLENPFSDFDFAAYFTILSDQIKAMVPNNPDIYFVKFREVTVTSVAALMNASEAGFRVVQSKAAAIGAAEYAAKIKAFAIDVFTAYWSELKQALYKTLVRPFITLLEQAVKNWIREVLLPAVVEYVQTNIIQELNFNAYKDIFGEIEEFAGDARKVYDEAGQTAQEVKAWAKEATAMVSNILMLVPDAKDIDSWSDGLQFALKLYKIIPPKIKNYLRELIDLPDWNFENVRLPDYALDVKNKFFAVTLYEYPGREVPKTDNFKAGVSIRLVAFVGDRKVTDSTGAVQKDTDGDDIIESGLYLLPVIRGNFGADFNVGQSHHLLLGANAALNPDVTAGSKNNSDTQKALESDTLGFFFTTKDGQFFPSAELLCSKNALSAYLELLFRRGQAGGATVQPLEIFKSGIADLTIGDYPQKLFLGYSEGFDVGYLGGMRNLLLKLRLHQINDFFAVILSNDIEIEVEKLDLGYSIKKGFQFEGEYRLRIPIKADLDLSVIRFTGINLELGSGDFKNVLVKLLTNFTVDFNGIALSFAEMGLGVDINYMKPEGGFGDLKFSPELQFPTGIGISIDLEAVKGTGIIKWNKEKEEFLGAVELNILDLCGASAMMLFNMKMPDGSKGFSFMGALSVFFTTGIQLGMGFSLTAIGGSLGINRRLEIEKLRDAVRDGSLGTILFVKDLDKNLDVVLGNITAYYPIQKDQFFFGFLAQITWAKVVKVDLGLFIQAPDPVTVIVAGGIHISISDALEGLLAINVYFMGGIDSSKGLFFDASLVDSRIVGIDLYGDMALRIYWAGDTKGFLFSAGGFHPQFTPEAGFSVANMKRLGMSLNYGILKFSLESYFALTSNTVQFGAHARLKIGWDEFGLIGECFFNALFGFNPFRLMTDFGASLAVKCGGWTLLSVSLYMSLSGPAPWNAKGKASFTFILIPIKVSFDLSWGKAQTTSSRKYIEVLPLYTENFYDNSNWKVIPGDLIDGLVAIKKVEGPDLVMQPSDLLSFNQSAVPFDQDMVRYGEDSPGDARKITLKEVKIGGVKADFNHINSSFAPTLIRELNKDEKLKAPSYENMRAGFELKTGFGMEKGDGIVDAPGYEIKYQDIDWSRWEQYANSSDKDKPAKMRKLAITPVSKSKAPNLQKKWDARRRSDSQRLSDNISEAPLPRVSFRRDRTGFKRYTLELDRLLSRPMDHLMDELRNIPNK